MYIIFIPIYAYILVCIYKEREKKDRGACKAGRWTAVSHAPGRVSSASPWPAAPARSPSTPSPGTWPQGPHAMLPFYADIVWWGHFFLAMNDYRKPRWLPFLCHIHMHCNPGNAFWGSIAFEYENDVFLCHEPCLTEQLCVIKGRMGRIWQNIANFHPWGWVQLGDTSVVIHSP